MPQETSSSRPLGSAGDATVTGNVASATATSLAVSNFGNYELLGELSRGGVGIIYRARQRGLGRVVALKVLQGGSMASAEQVQRFMNEAQAAAKLQHPNIVPIHDFGSQDGQYFFTMDFVEGKSLADLMEKGPIPAREALEYVRQTAEALHYAHEHGVVHRDIKPGNILLDEAGRVKLTDFGIAKEVNRDQLSMTMEGQVMGTPRYMSPEQASGKTALADRRSDVFSLGATFYEMLTATPAFDAENVYGVLQKVVTFEPPAPHKLNRKVHRDVATICLKAMEKRPENRYQTALEMAEDIQRFVDGEPIEARPVGSIEQVARRLKRHWRAVAVNAGILACAAYGVWFYLQARPAHLRVELSPSPVNVALDGHPVAQEDVERGLDLPAGRHTLLVDLEPTFEPRELGFDLKPGEQRSLVVRLARRHGKLVLTTEPPDAAITVVGPDNFHAPFRGPRVERDLPTGPYAVLVHRENHLAQRIEVNVVDGQTHALHFALPSVTLWTVPTSGHAMAVPAVADMDNDGWGDVVAGDDAGKIYCLSGRNGVALWVHGTRDAVQAPLRLADLNRDGVPDVLAGSTDGTLYCLNGKNGAVLWAFATRGSILGATLARDLNGDNVPDAITGSGDGNVYAVSGVDGKLLWRYETNGRIESCLAWAGSLLLVGSADKHLHVIQPQTGQLAWKVDVGVPLLFPPRLENGLVVLPTPKSAGDARTVTAVSLSERKLLPTGEVVPQLLDLDGDGQAERIIVTDKGTSVFASDGVRLLWSCDYQAVGCYAADVDGDGTYDLIFNNGPDELLCLSGSTGAVIGRIKLDTATGRGFALEDLDRDGVPDVVVGAGNKLYCFSWTGGRRQWVVKADSYYDVPCVADGGRVLAKNSSGELAAYEPSRSEPLWKRSTSAQPSPHTGLAAGEGIVADADAKSRRLRAWSVADGRMLWEQQLAGTAGAEVGWPAIGRGFIVAGNGLDALICRALTNGIQHWSVPLEKVTTAPAIGVAFIVAADGENSLHCLALADGRSLWRFQAPTADPFPSPPTLLDVTADGTEDVVALNDNGFVYALDGQSGRVLWQFEHAPMRARTRNRLVAVPGSAEGVIANAKGDVLRLNLKQGKVIWRTSLRAVILGEPAVADMNQDGIADVVVGTVARRLHCLSGKDGAELWSSEVGAQIRFSAPLLLKTAQDGAPLVFVGTGPPDNALYCLRGSSPRLNPRDWLSPWK